MIEFYVLETCPYCKKVLNFANENNIKYEIKEISNQKNHDKLIELGGKDQVPFMVDGDVNMYESDDIIEYLKKRDF